MLSHEPANARHSRPRNRCAPKAPGANAICERVVGTLRREAFDQMMIFNERRLFEDPHRVHGALQ
ncbi:MAG: hypothetical protein QOE54_806 [Streptosporangiaceae bacterium]|jgi:transposase|nr:hypothetical protein [Streptosporangiaceae bacterium]MDX6428440.1 hypothetical protein [Streptosporangiaceae bacterium]